MANYTGNPNIFTPGISFLDNDLNWDLPNPFTMAPINPSLLQNSNLELQSLMGFSSINNDKILNENQMSQLHAKLLGNLVEPTPTTTVKIPSLSASSHQVKTSIVQQQPSIDPQIEASIVSSRYGNESSISTTTNKRKVEDLAESSCSLYSSPSNSNRPPKKNSSSRGKKSNKSIEKVEGNSKDVVHVRARRGQATDSHSIAERVRRGKINERLRCLQDIVPGCYKTMGMAVMLDEIINYVQSLQNQVEFLSMKLTAASQYHDFNAESEPEEKKQKIKACNSEEAHDMERIINKGGYDQVALDNFFQSGWPF